jgi:peptidoglycan/xylan/chitin deacetylase (PgdA/CDA1 family)
LNRSAILLLVCLTAVAAPLLWPHSPLAVIALLVLAHAAIFLPIFVPRLDWSGPVVTGFETTERAVWLTIDDGPDPRDTPAILELLARHGARATFFVVGERAERWPDTVASLAAAGHTVENHSQRHSVATSWCQGRRELVREIEACSAVVARLTGRRPTCYRPPVGFKSWSLSPTLERLGLHLVQWSARGFDGLRDFCPDRVARRILAQVRPGAILLLHQGVTDAGGEPLSPQLLERVLQRLSDDGYRCVVPEPSQLR